MREFEVMNLGSNGLLRKELTPLHPEFTHHGLTPTVAKSKPYWFAHALRKLHSEVAPILATPLFSHNE